MNLLVVDDYPETADSLRILLEMYGHEVQIATSSAEAVSKVQKEHDKDRCFDAIVLDYLLPGDNGLEVIGKIRQLCCQPGAPIVLTTAADITTADSIRAEANKKGRVGFIRKPFTPGELFNEINRVVNETKEQEV